MKRRSNTSQKSKRHEFRFFLDRNLGALQLATQLRGVGLDVTVHDDIYERTERDPWIFYDRGKAGMIVVTSDKTFMKSFPHMAAIALGETTVLFFSKNNWRSEFRGSAFIDARSRIIHSLKKQPTNFLACIGMNGSFSISDKGPKPLRKLCDPQDWESYRRVCESEGITMDTEIGRELEPSESGDQSS